MKEVHYFIADDGTRFEEEEDCQKYEFKLTLAPRLANCRAFGPGFNPIPFNSQNMVDGYLAENVMYLYIGDKAGFDAIDYHLKEFGYVAPSDFLEFNGPMFLSYNDMEARWEDLEAIIHSYQDQVNNMKDWL